MRILHFASCLVVAYASSNYAKLKRTLQSEEFELSTPNDVISENIDVVETIVAGSANHNIGMTAAYSLTDFIWVSSENAGSVTQLEI